MRRPSSPRSVVVLLVASSLWLFLGEVGVHYVYSLRWQWPRLLSTEFLDRQFIRHYPRGIARDLLDTTLRYHYQSGDTHLYYRIPGSGGDVEETRLHALILSDPHIMCTFDEEELWLARKDADHYLSTVYSHLMSTLHPDIVILLGDIFSDGFQASADQWKDYINCLGKVFPLPSSRVKLIVSFGDNDIGGEGRDMMTDQVTRRYTEAFGALNSGHSIGGIQFIKLTTVCFINGNPRTQAEKKCREDLELYVAKNKATFQGSHAPRLVLSHIPLHQTHTNHHHFVRNEVLEVEPSYIFSGHIHHESYSSHVIWDKRGRSLVRRLAHEITVPTCSYRMGEQFMGAGVAVISSNGDLAYRVLWLPPRYPFFASYGIVAIILTLTFWFKCMYRCRSYRYF